MRNSSQAHKKSATANSQEHRELGLITASPSKTPSIQAKGEGISSSLRDTDSTEESPHRPARRAWPRRGSSSLVVEDQNTLNRRTYRATQHRREKEFVLPSGYGLDGGESASSGPSGPGRGGGLSAFGRRRNTSEPSHLSPDTTPKGEGNSSSPRDTDSTEESRIRRLSGPARGGGLQPSVEDGTH